jgi:hypothetical protein
VEVPMFLDRGEKSIAFFDVIRLHHTTRSLEEENLNNGFRENPFAVSLFPSQT